MKGKLLLLLIFLNTLSSAAQNGKKPFVVGARIHSGYNIPVYRALRYIVENDLNASDLSLSFQSTGKNYWEKLYNYPRTGIGYSYWTLGNDKILGRAHALYTFINIPLDKDPGRISFNFQASAGGAYLPRKFNITDNPLNRAIGSNYNIYIRLGIEARVKLSQKFELFAEAGTTHFSNGKTRSPNYGINIATVSVGINSLCNYDYLAKNDTEIPAVNRKIIYSIFVSAGPKVYDNLYGYKYVSGTVSFNLEKYVNNIGRAGLGTDLFYDGSIGEALSENGVTEDELVKLLRAGIHVSYAFRYKKVSAGANIGYYVYSKKIVLTSIYNKIFIQYMLSRNITGSISVRSHWGKADCLEYGIGYSW